MRIGNHKKKSSASAILLIAVFSLLQLALWGPSFLHTLSGKGGAGTCQNDHILCGCSPGRIAAETCCCALAALSPCCQKYHLEQEQEEKAASGTVLTSLPCGGSEDPLVATGSETYLLPAMKIPDSPVSITVYPLSSAMSRIDLNILPPTPPPKA